MQSWRRATYHGYLRRTLHGALPYQAFEVVDAEIMQLLVWLTSPLFPALFLLLSSPPSCLF